MFYFVSATYFVGKVKKEGVFRILFDGQPTNERLFDTLLEYAKTDARFSDFQFSCVNAFYQISEKRINNVYLVC